MIRSADIYELRLFDTTLARFSFGEFDPVVLHEFDESRTDVMPAGMRLDDEGLWRWLSSRAIPQNRRFATELCRSLGLSPNDRSGIIAASLGLSLNDSYWIVPEGFGGTFAECNLFENGFSEVLAAVAYTGVVSNLQGLTPSTPELTTNGNLRKAWRIEADGTRRLYKGSTDEGNGVGEARVEFLASQVAQAMGLDAVRYDLARWSGEDTAACSTCACFCTPETSYVPQALAFGDTSHVGAVRTYLGWNDEQFERYASMMVFDALICNTDRHLTNFGILRDSRTGTYLGTAPIFDNGRSLLFNLSFDQAGDLAREARFALPSWPQVTFEEQARRLMGAEQKAQLERLADFEFANSDKAPFPEGYLRSLAAFVRRRAEELAACPDVPREALRAAVRKR
ncbi:HipA domain-containing protein [Arabiibacter massiliensis]|uniref:hypothetical protein n=1 Tax=Arabiibacter massiliensis TaxID=1870985 RepID=UPI0009BA88CC|nr:hypothetical protein [Arabiibacter massiliensis]